MDLNNVTVETRPRRSWEAIDLGFRLARAHAGALWGAWLCVYAPIAALICFAFRNDPWLAGLLIWWLKPWFDRVALHVLSRAVFGATPSVIETLRSLPKMFRRGTITGILNMRFDAARSLNLALWQLEELPYARWRQRIQLIETPVRRPAGWLTVTCMYFEATIIATVFALIYWMIPPDSVGAVESWWYASGNQATFLPFAVLIAWVIAVAVIEPFYIAGGFALYLNRRSELEAWDIEIAFRRIAQRHGHAAQAVA